MNTVTRKIRLRIACCVWREKDGSIHANTCGWHDEGMMPSDALMLNTAASAAFRSVGYVSRCIITVDVDVPPEGASVPEVSGTVTTT